MKAYYSTEYGGPEYAFFGELPDPTPKTGELIVKVKAVSINPVDYKIMQGATRLISGSKFPGIFGKQGALAELQTVKPEKIRKIPVGMSFEEAASLPVASLTALNGLRRCNVREGSRVLINGGTGGVGHFAIQIAKARGAYITSTSGSSNFELAKKLGADDVSGDAFYHTEHGKPKGKVIVTV